MSKKMNENYLNLKNKLEELGYCNTLPLEAVPLVESLLSDLLQTTRSLQHYMKLSKDALDQRDALVLEAEPYKWDNTRLIQETNSLNRDLIALKEENMKLCQDSKRKIKKMSEDIAKKEIIINKLQHDIRELSLRGLCAETQSFRNKSKKKDSQECSKICFCVDPSSNSDKVELNNKIQCLEEQIAEFSDEITILKSQVNHRDNEIVRLNILLEGGRPLSKEKSSMHCDLNNQSLLTQLHELEVLNGKLRKEVESGRHKQHEAMSHAVQLAEKNKLLQEEIKKVDSLALKVEDDCNKRIADLMNEITFLQSRIDNLLMKNTLLETEISQTDKLLPKKYETEESLKLASKEKELLNKEIKDLLELNRSLQDRIVALTQNREISNREEPTKSYEKHITNIQEQLSETVKKFNEYVLKCNRDKCPHASNGSEFVKDLHTKLCESEQKLLMLKKDNDELKNKISTEQNDCREYWKEIVKQLNIENAELSKENISLSQKLSYYKNVHIEKISDREKPIEKKLRQEIEQLKKDLDVMKRDREEYKIRYKEAISLVDKLRSDLASKQSEVEQLQEENCSYKTTHRTGKASVDRLKEECDFLKEQIRKLQNDVIKERTMANQIKNIQIETERSSHDMQSELHNLQKKLSISKDTITSLEKKCDDLQMEINILKDNKINLFDNVKKIDQERDKLVIELDNKAETICVLEQKLKTQTHDIQNLEDVVSNLKRKLNYSQAAEHKVKDYEMQIKFLNGEINRWSMQYDNALMESKQLQNSLADTNAALKVAQIEHGKAKREIDELKQQLQHYVAEVRRIEEMLSQKEAERSDMLEHFASLSVEANILENTNHSLESESASKSLQLQNYILKIQELESKVLEKDIVIEKLSAKNAELTCKLTSLHSEVKLVTEEKKILEQNVNQLKEVVKNVQPDVKTLKESDSELKLYENRIKSLSNTKSKLEGERIELEENLLTTERLLSNARKEIIDLKLALQDATAETKLMRQKINRFENQVHERESLSTRELDLPPLMLEETIHEVSHEEDEDSTRFREITKRYSKYTHGSTL